MISLDTNIQAIQHGGNLEQAIKRYKITQQGWIDLSTGISPWAYPFKPLPDHIWQQLPLSNNELIARAAQYYGVNPECIAATPGSQIAIRLIPQLIKPASVAIPSLGYQEHAVSWQMANHQIVRYSNISELYDHIHNKRIEHVVVINPNNPSCGKLGLNDLADIISSVSGVCIIDEAFMDYYEADVCTDILSVTKIANFGQYDNLIVLRSIGKFFGLAGVRLGFAIGLHPSLSALNSLLNPWSISHATQLIGIQALQDTQWQQQQADKIKQQQSSFQKTLKILFDKTLEQYSTSDAGLFNTVFADKTSLKELHHRIAKQGVWIRNGNDDDQPSWLRFGLPKDINEFEKRIFSLLP